MTQVFRYLDHRGKNRLSFYDFSKTFKENGINVSKHQIQNMIDIIDSDGNNTIEYQEFLRAMCDKDTLYNDKNLESVFNSIDMDQKGYINVDDIKKFIFKNKDVADITFCNYLKQIGMDLNSKLKLDQFVDIIRNQKLYHFNKNNKEIDMKNNEDTFEEEKNNDEVKPKRIRKVKILENEEK